MFALLTTFSWQELRHHPWRNAAAVVAVMLGVALAFSVQLINASALAEFSSAVTAVSGRPDLELRARQGLLDDTWLERVAAHPGVAVASPVLERSAFVLDAQGARVPVKLVGVDALSVANTAPGLMPQPDAATGGGARRLDLFAPDAVFLNPSARAKWRQVGTTLRLQNGQQVSTVRVIGQVNAPGPPLLVMDVAAAQELTGHIGQLSRIALRLQTGVQPQAVLDSLALPAHLLAQLPEQVDGRMDRLSRAYRVNLTVLALVALFTGAFLVYSVLSLSVSKRQQQFALLGVLGLSARERLRLVLCESALLGVLGSVLGVALGTALAALALRWLGGDLGGGYFAGEAPRLLWSLPMATGYAALGVAAALVGGWWPARAMQRMAPAPALKGLGAVDASGQPQHRRALAMLLAAGLLAWAPPVAGLALAAYLSVGLLLVGGVVALPLVVGVVLRGLAPWVATRALPLLAVERARRLRETAAVATSGVVASLALSVALTVMVASFRDSVAQWLDTVLPAQLYVRTAGGQEGNSLPPDFVRAVADVPGVVRVDPLRTTQLQLDPALPALTLLARPLNATSDQRLPLIDDAWPVPTAAPGETLVPVYVSEAVIDVYGVRAGGFLPQLGLAFDAALAPSTRFFIAGVWRDYARQNGSVLMDSADYQRLTGDARVNDLAVHLADDADAADAADATAVRERVLQLAESLGTRDLIEIASVGQIRAVSLRIFDRSFAVTYWLQAVAIGIGLFGVA
uniref:ABC transporter permease n=1 Tax=Hydrogenophaga sp. TaxID=1904254 RepID=UPI003567BA98